MKHANVVKVGVVALFVLGVALACATRADNPPAPGFDAAGSDAAAVALADRAMEAMGGRAAWDAVQTLGWTIFKRTHLWNRWTGEYRLDADTLLVKMNVNTGQGRVWRSGVEVTDAAERDPVLERATSIWINDSYWLVMPYKLKDTGVTLRYGGEHATDDGRAADMIVMTFANVGDTPENKYEVYVDKESGLVTQWSYYPTVTDAEPKFTLPWTDWTQMNGVRIAMGRGRTTVSGVTVSAGDERARFDAP